jgi:hypothetical protein
MHSTAGHHQQQGLQFETVDMPDVTVLAARCMAVIIRRLSFGCSVCNRVTVHV